MWMVSAHTDLRLPELLRPRRHCAVHRFRGDAVASRGPRHCASRRLREWRAGEQREDSAERTVMVIPLFLFDVVAEQRALIAYKKFGPLLMTRCGQLIALLRPLAEAAGFLPAGREPR